MISPDIDRRPSLLHSSFSYLLSNFGQEKTELLASLSIYPSIYKCRREKLYLLFPCAGWVHKTSGDDRLPIKLFQSKKRTNQTRSMRQTFGLLQISLSNFSSLEKNLAVAGCMNTWLIFWGYFSRLIILFAPFLMTHVIANRRYSCQRYCTY